MLVGLSLLRPPATIDGASAGAAPSTVAVRADLVASMVQGRTSPAVVRAMREAGPPYADWAAGRHFLHFDAEGDGMAVEAVGDLSTADRVVVLVPGVATRLDDFDRGLGGVARRAPGRQARTVLAEALRLDPRARVAVVAWLGYDPPDGAGLEVARRARAVRGGAALVDFLAALALARPTATVTVVGHSYGAVVLGAATPGLAARPATAGAVTDLVALGAPGMGVADVDGLGTGARVWAGTAVDDWIRRVPGVRVFAVGHGRHPTDPEFGARRLPVPGVGGHDHYLEPGSAALRAVALIGLGRTAEVGR